MDNYKTIAAQAETKTVIKKSTFLAFSLYIETEEEAVCALKDFRKRFYDARHVCYAYVIGTDSKTSKSSDNGEPSGTAGRPILGAIMSAGLTNVMIVVVRYFGGVLLGTPGLIAAYKEGATSVIETSGIVTKTHKASAIITFDYIAMNDVMKLVKQLDIRVTDNKADTRCTLTIKAPKTVMETALSQLAGINSLKIVQQQS